MEADSWDAPFRYCNTNRIEGKSFWKRECPSKEEFENAIQNLNKHGNKVDFILTHEGLSSDALGFGSIADLTCKMNDIINRKTNFRFWFFGHHHKDLQTSERRKCVFKSFENIKEYMTIPYKFKTDEMETKL